jgi:hypothetical protein
MLRATLLTLGLLLGASAAHAADACYRDEIGDTLVFKNFRMPRPGDCRPLSGHVQNSETTLDGTVCGTSDGTRLIFNFNYILTATATGPYHFVIGRQDTAAAGHSCDENTNGGPWGCSNFLVFKIDCPRPTIIN